MLHFKNYCFILSLSLSFLSLGTVTEGRVKHVDYKLIVKCQHRQGPEEEWITWRRFSDLHDFHLKLKVRESHCALIDSFII